MKSKGTKFSVHKRIKLLNYVSFGLVISITLIISFFSNHYTDTINNIREDMETQWRDEAKDKAKYLAQQLELSIVKDNINYWDDLQLHSWAEEKLLPMKVGGPLSNVMLVNIGYSVRNWDELNWFTVKNELLQDIPQEYSEMISDYFKDIDFIGKSNIYVKEFIDQFTSEFNIDNNLSKDQLTQAIQKVLFVENKVIMDTNPSSIVNNKFLNSRFIEDYFIQDKNRFDDILKRITSGVESEHYDRTTLSTTSGDKWLEWCVVPPNKLGWELQAPYKEGVDNVGYKKIAIIIELDVTEIEKLHSDAFQSVEQINTICSIVVLTMVSGVILILFTSFYNFLKQEDE